MDSFWEGEKKPMINSLRTSLLEASHSFNIVQKEKRSDLSYRKHPKLIKLLSILRHSSPQRLTSDAEQPLSGCIGEILQLRLSKSKEVAPGSNDSSPNLRFRKLTVKIEDNKASVLLNLCKNSRYRNRTMGSSK